LAIRTLRRPPRPANEASGSVGVATATRARLLAVCAAALALVASIVVAAGPARGESAEYAWPPATLPAESPERGFYAPLPLLNRVPASIEVQLPCGLAPPLRDARPVTVLATARRAETAGALRIAGVDDALRISVGASDVAELPWPTSCPLRVEVADGELRLPSRAVSLQTQTLDDMPIVTGLFTGLDLRAGEPPRVVIRTRDYATSWTARQFVAAALAVALVCLALILLVRPRRRGVLGRIRRGISSVWEARGTTDAAVLGVLLVWWVVAPTLFDDGWIWVELRAFDDIGTLDFYYDVWGVGLPLGYWVEWLRHWAIASTSDLVFMRVPALLALFAAWLLCRWCLYRVVPAPVSWSVRWTLAGAFLVGATAWGMTLRLEPFVSVLVLASLAAMISFALAPRLAPLAVAVSATVFATTAHPTGLVAGAPLLAAAPEIVGWLRRGERRILFAFGALLLAGLALALVLFTIDADLATRLSDARLAREGDVHAEPWWREYIRYTTFDAWGGGIAIRRLSVALIMLSVVALLTRRRSAVTGVLVLPARSVVVALALLALVPSKWPWHFGAIAAVGAVALAAEVARLIGERDEPRWRAIRPILALASVGAIVLWSWRAPGWSLLDLQETSWRSGFNADSFLVLIAILAISTAVSIRSGSKREGLEASVGRALAIVSFAAVGLTCAILIRDAAVTAWSPARQNLEALAGRSSCGLAHQLRGEGNVSDLLADPNAPVYLEPLVTPYFPCATIPTIEDGLVEVPRFVVFQRRPRLLLDERDSPFAAVSDLYGLTSIAHGPREVEVLSVADTIPGFVRVDADRRPGEAR